MMKSFLEYVADDIIRRFSDQGTERIDLTDIAVVFPNKRASLFLNQYLYKAAGNRPIWCPQYITISDLFHSQSELNTADPILANCILYDVYSKYMQAEYDKENAAHPEREPRQVESLDRFWSWGEMMIADFDDLDKNMGDASLIFNNVRELEALKAQPEEYLNETQMKALMQFFNLVDMSKGDNEKSILKHNFEMLWNNLGNIYRDFNTAMLAKGLAYEGALYREVAERADCLEWKCKKYLFVGFNMTQKCEQRIFKSMKDQELALFYWDYDNYYADKEAGHFINKELLLKFPNALKDHEEVFENIRCHDEAGNKVMKDITYLSASTENIQARYIADWLTEEGKNRLAPGQRTAIVLSDESLLKNVIHSLPEETSGKANITVGFPLAQSPVTSLVKNYLILHREGNDLRKVSNILRHPYAGFLSPKASELLRTLHDNRIFFPTQEDLCQADTPDNLDLLLSTCSEMGVKRNEILMSRLLEALRIIGQECEHRRIERCVTEGKDPDTEDATYEEQFMQESLFRMHGILTRLHDLCVTDEEGYCALDIDMTTLIRLVDQIIKTTSMPFHGEPAVNLQIMGVLETRNLDFDHVLLLSCNEGNLPKGINDSSLIPHIIRKAHGLTTVENKVAIYAYYFYRLMQRCGDITIAYNSSTEDGHTGQMSRFMLQMMVENDYMNFRQVNLTARQLPEAGHSREVAKEGPVLEALNMIFSLSPSAINKYLRCPLMFYFNRLAGLSEIEEEDFIDSRQFGSIFHAAAENMYKDIRGANGEVTKENIEYLLSDKGSAAIDRYIDDAFRTEFFNGRTPHYDGMQTINQAVIKRFIRQLLNADKEMAPFRVVGLEQYAYERISFTLNNGNERRLMIGGSIDRLDCISDGGEQVLRVVDYKTGRTEPAVQETIDAIFDPKNIKDHSDYLLQSMLYSVIVRHSKASIEAYPKGEKTIIPALNPASDAVRPALLYIQKPKSVKDPVLKFGDKKDPKPVNDVLDYEEDFRKGLYSLLAEIFDETVPFRPTEETRRCENCSFKALCKQ